MIFPPRPRDPVRAGDLQPGLAAPPGIVARRLALRSV